MNAETIRIGVNPAIDLLRHGVPIAAFSRDCISCCKRYQVLVTSQFPDELDVAYQAVIPVIQFLAK